MILPAFTDAENLDEEGRPADEDYENIVDENEDDDLSTSEDEEEMGGSPPQNNPQEETSSSTSSSTSQPASNSAASSDTVAPNAEPVVLTQSTTPTENGVTRSDTPKTTPPDNREQGAPESKPETTQVRSCLMSLSIIRACAHIELRRRKKQRRSLQL